MCAWYWAVSRLFAGERFSRMMPDRKLDAAAFWVCRVGR